MCAAQAMLERVRIVQAYDAEENNELTIAEGDEVNVYRKNDDSGWWFGEITNGTNKGKKGVQLFFCSCLLFFK